MQGKQVPGKASSCLVDILVPVWVGTRMGTPFTAGHTHMRHTHTGWEWSMVTMFTQTSVLVFKKILGKSPWFKLTC